MTPTPQVPLLAWVIFHAVVFGVLALDLGLFNRGSREVTLSRAFLWTGLWVLLSLGFCAGLAHLYSRTGAMEFLAGYLVEYALSIDNIFVFILIFTYFQVKPRYQHRILFWGVIGAFVMRGIMIFAGSALMHRFEWLAYVFGLFLIYTSVKLLKSDDNEVDPGNNLAVNLLRRIVPISRDYRGHHFFTMENGRRVATPLLVVLTVVETTDLVFAIDSIPAIFGVVKSRDAFIIYTSNVCAILGLRSLYFVLAKVIGLFHLLKYGLACVLAFVGVEMLLPIWEIKLPIWASLSVIVTSIGLSVLASLAWPKPNDEGPLNPA